MGRVGEGIDLYTGEEIMDRKSTGHFNHWQFNNSSDSFYYLLIPQENIPRPLQFPSPQVASS